MADITKLEARIAELEVRIRELIPRRGADEEGTTHGCTHGCTGDCPDPTGDCTYGCTDGCTNGCTGSCDRRGQGPEIGQPLDVTRGALDLYRDLALRRPGAAASPRSERGR
jgi:hypothetical protein